MCSRFALVPSPNCAPARISESAPGNPHPRFRPALLGLLALFSVGCSAATEEFEVDQDHGSTHAVVRVRHSTAQDGSTRGDALTGFVKVPAGADPENVFSLAGLVQSRPPVGDCRREGTIGEGVEISEVYEAELLEAQSMDLLTVAGTHSLAPFAFPTVADLLRGVVYTSRDRSGRDLPTGVAYSLEARGIHGSDAASSLSLSSQHESPKPPANVTVGGIAFSQLSNLPLTGVLDLSWESSADQNDAVMVTLREDRITWNCSFADSEGFGSVPLLTDNGFNLAENGSMAQLEVHRIRSANRPGTDGLADVRVTFDFAIEAAVTFSTPEE